MESKMFVFHAVRHSDNKICIFRVSAQDRQEAVNKLSPVARELPLTQRPELDETVEIA